MWSRVGCWMLMGAACTGAETSVDGAVLDVSETRPMTVRAVPATVGHAVGFSGWGATLPDIPAGIDWPNDPVSIAMQDYQQARADYARASPVDRTVELHALHRTRDEVLRADSLAAGMTVESGASAWEAAIALHRLTQRALDDQRLESPESVARAATALLVAYPDHAASVHARLVLANLAAAPTLDTYDPEQSLAWAIEALEHDAAVAPQVARLLERLPGDLPLADWVYDELRPQWQAAEDSSMYDATFDHALRRGHVDDALREQALVVRDVTVWCAIPEAQYACRPYLDWKEESAARLLRLGWSASSDWRAHVHAAIAECAEGTPLPMELTLSWDETWSIDAGSDSLAGCVSLGLSAAPSPVGPASVSVTVTP